MNVMEVVQSLEKGGRTVRFSDTVEGLRQSGITVTPVCFSQPADWVELPGIVVINRRKGINWSLVFKLIALIRQSNIDIIHAHCEFSQLYAGLAGRICGVKTIGTFHRSDMARYEPSTVNSLIKLSLSHFVSVSNDRMRLLREKLKVSTNNSSVVHGGTRIDQPPTLSSIEKQRKRLDIDPSKLMIFSLGHLGEIKGHQFTLEALAMLLPDHPELVLYIAGDGSPAERKNLEEMASRLNLSKQVNFLGQIDNAPEWMEAADIFVQPSLEEAFGLVFIEAGAMAKPVVATQVGGIVDIIDNGKTGILIPPSNAEALANALRELIASPNLRKQMGNEGYERVSKKFSLDHMINSYIEIFERYAAS
ncbi:glycosyltransferase family 4 protein [Motiliproteus sp. MSK22-1]|uniref:glycosyltransferase family 4 protein n=1 Tax=Motiliproteus sp. MSK22-1 TaxID=1897630 RepID=UPI00097633E4|nr:glycosyltransferase family 4 protein [Motiliproteus sp. MSK22-1]OMH25666.1 hypothetical protein BGP75_24290 [Motiliproteus sp. MSK22-1]